MDCSSLPACSASEAELLSCALSALAEASDTACELSDVLLCVSVSQLLLHHASRLAAITPAIPITASLFLICPILLKIFVLIVSICDHL